MNIRGSAKGVVRQWRFFGAVLLYVMSGYTIVLGILGLFADYVHVGEKRFFGWPARIAWATSGITTGLALAYMARQLETEQAQVDHIARMHKLIDDRPEKG